MLPFSGQGANQGIEGSGILGEMFKGVDADLVPQRVAEFEQMRIKRITTLKLLSRIRFGKENNAAYSLIKHDRLKQEGAFLPRTPQLARTCKRESLMIGSDIPQSFHERLQFEWKCDVFEDFEKWKRETSLASGHTVYSP